MWPLLPLLLIPVLVMLGFKLKNPDAFTAREFVVLELGMAFLLTAGFFLAREAAMADTEVWSGRISKKASGTEHCCHCRNVCTSRDAKGNCRATRQDCTHVRDYWWRIYVNTGDSIDVQRCSGSSSAPAAWENAYVGEPAAVEHSFRNYLKADPESVLRQSAAVAKSAPPYPRVFGLYHIRRAANMGTKMDAVEWSKQLDEVLADLGHQRYVNINVIATRDPDPTYAEAVERDWLYGKLNDVTFVLGAPDGETVTWAAVVTLPTGNESLRVAGRDALVGASLTDPKGTIEKMVTVVKAGWRWRGVEDLKYLAAAAQPPTWAIVLLYAIGIIGSVWGSAYMVDKDLFGENFSRHY